MDIAVEAAQKAYDTAWGLNAPGSVRTELLWKLAQLMERDALELAALEALDNGICSPYLHIFTFLSKSMFRQNIQLGEKR